MKAHRPVRRWPSLAIVLAVLLVGFGAVLTATPPAAAVTYVSGWITASTTWGALDNVYVVTKHVTVRPGVILTILPGTTVRFDAGMALFIEGSLTANGAAGLPISFLPNSSVLNIPWYGIAFNASATGSVTRSMFDNCERAVMATDSSPVVNNDTVQRAGVGFLFYRSSTVLADNVVQRSSFAGAYLNASNVQVVRNTFNSSAVGIMAEGGGSPYIASNTLTNITSGVAIGISITGGTVADLWWNAIRSVGGSRGANGFTPGADGFPGGAAFGVLLDSAPSATIQGNTFDVLVGGRGGDGAENPGGAGGRGGTGGPAAAVVVANTPTVDIDDNVIRTVTGGRGGNGGTGPTTVNGGSGGTAGDAVGIGVGLASGAAWWYKNVVDGVAGGAGGNGAVATGTDGSGGNGGNGVGLLFSGAMDADVSGNTFQNLRGGLGGNSSATGLGRGAGADGGDATGLTAYSLKGWTTFHSNTVAAVRAGNGGRGQARGGAGGNATGIFAVADSDGNYNFTTATSNWVQGLTGGNGGIGQRIGGNGGTVTGLGFMLSDFYSGVNIVSSLVGGNGGDALDGTDGGRGGDADGIGAFAVRSGWSAWDSVDTVSRGAPGTGPPVQASYGVAFYFVGSPSVLTTAVVENATIQGIGSLDLWADNYTEVTTINTPFNTAKLAVSAAGNLTVRNYLQVDVLWPDGVTFVAGASILVTDEGTPVWNLASPTGSESWLLVTDRMYVNSVTPRDNRTEVTVSYLSYNFGSNPRQVAMATSHTETFTMVDLDPPTSSVALLPVYTNTWSFTVGYTASDGNGVGLNTITLWYRRGGGWTSYATQPAAAAGSFAFTATVDGVYEFTTTADDLAGNREPGPSVNDTWTIVDTVLPGSRVIPLPTWENSRSFTVTWAPDPGVTDIAQYDIQYNRGLGWFTWLSGTTQTSGTFTALSDGTFRFRSVATDYAGNVEVLPAGNDTWTIIDTAAPFSFVQPLPVYETSTSFLVQWAPESDDVATYRIQSRDNGVAWTDWIASTNLTSGTFTGAIDGHTYEFRSIATDYAGNVQTPPANNQSWTIVDVSPPDSAVSPLPAYETTLLFTVNWGPVSGTSDIATYTLEVSDNGGPWTQVPGVVGVTTVSTSFVGVDGHRVAFRTLARDRAGNVEPGPSGNDTWTIIDVTRPSVITGSPRGAGTNVTPLVTVTFSEAMNRASAEAAFTITPDMNGQFAWSADSRLMTFVPERPLQAGTDYVVTIDSSARDVAGNTGSAPYTFQFGTAVSTTIGGLGDWLWIILAIITAAIVVGLLLLLLRRRGAMAGETAPAAAAKRPEEPAVIDDVFLLYNDGILIKHETRRLKPDVDTDILSGMLTAVQQFVKDSFRSEEGELDEMTFGQMHILIGRGKWVILAAMVSGDGTVAFTEQIKACIADIEEHQWDRLEGWNGDMVIAKTLSPYVKKLIRGDYA